MIWSILGFLFKVWLVLMGLIIVIEIGYVLLLLFTLPFRLIWLAFTSNRKKTVDYKSLSQCSTVDYKYKCKICGHTFDFPDLTSYYDTMLPEMEICPKCGSDYLEFVVVGDEI